MAQLIALNVYQINSMDPIPLASVPRISFPFAGILVRAMNASGTTGVALSTGQVVYSQVQLINASPQQPVYAVAETPAQITSAS